MRPAPLLALTGAAVTLSACAAVIDFPDVPNVTDGGRAHDATPDVRDATTESSTNGHDAAKDVARDAYDASGSCDAGTVCEGACVDLATSLENCGACGVACGGTCASGRCLTVLAANQSMEFAIGSLAVDESNVYWANAAESVIVKVGLDGGTPVTVAAVAGGVLDIELANERLVWLSDALGAVSTVATDGGAVRRLATGQPLGDGNHGLTVHKGTVYWTNGPVVTASEAGVPEAGATVRSVALDGGAVTTLATNQPTPTTIVASDRALYWFAQGGAGTYEIASAGLDGSAPTVTARGLTDPSSLVASGASLYWTQENGVDEVATDGGAAVLASSPLAGAAAGLAVDDSFLYWTEFSMVEGVSYLYKASRDGGVGTTVTSLSHAGDVYFQGLVVGATSLYFTDGNNIFKLTPK